MKIINCKPLIDFNKTNEGNQTSRTEAQIESARNNIAKINLEKRKLKNLFKKSNEFWKLRKGFKHSEITKTIISMRNNGHKSSGLQRITASQNFYKNNPMKNLETIKKWKAIRKRNKKLRKNKGNAISLPEFMLIL